MQLSLNIFRRKDTSTPLPNAAVVTEAGDLFNPAGDFVASYSRRRDAIRGAKRRGWEVLAA